MSSPAREMNVTSKVDLVMTDVINHIRSGTYPPGSKLPSAAEMRAHYEVSQQTIRTAVDRLKAVGWVTGVPGAGIFVADNPPT